MDVNDIKLDNRQSEQLQEALEAAFLNKTSLARMVYYELNHQLNTIVPDGSLEDTIFNLIVWAKSKGKLRNLIEAACKDNKENPHLRTFARQLGLCQDDQNLAQEAPTTAVRFIVAAMTAADARVLADHVERIRNAEVLHIAGEHEQMVTDLYNALQESGYPVDDLLARYGAEPENWRPSLIPESLDPTHDIGAVIKEIIRGINTERVKYNPEAGKFEAEFLSTRFFTGTDQDVIDVRDEMHDMGGVLIVDPLSLLCDSVGGKLLAKGIAALDNVSSIVVSPYNPRRQAINELIESRISQKFLWPAFMRFQRFDQLCEFGVGDLLPLQRWLHSALPLTMQRIALPKQSNKKMIEEAMSDSKRGVRRAFDQF